uniref:sulfotransferase family 2 domain-containing protein n=1 Tax=Synechococcus sp. UW106 TaxID=368495 RepID=UPI000E0ECC35|nr:sulfotransferase family 2 domain-containing protein [Synechococcus sp. UW106]
MKASPRIAFLHIPKTAGQSIHHQISTMYDSDEICPARTNDQLYKMNISDIKKYNFFSGHLDWSIIKLAGPFDYTFTVTRDPIDRIISFYFYIAKEAKRFLKAGSKLPPGMIFCHDSSLEEYFNAKDNNMRQFILDHYDNFYSYYFASGTYSGNRLLVNNLSGDDILRLALINCKSLSKIYDISELENIKNEIESKFSVTLPELQEINKNLLSTPNSRSKELDLLAQGWNWKAKFSELSKLDYQLLNRLRATG